VIDRSDEPDVAEGVVGSGAAAIDVGPAGTVDGRCGAAGGSGWCSSTPKAMTPTSAATPTTVSSPDGRRRSSTTRTLGFARSRPSIAVDGTAAIPARVGDRDAGLSTPRHVPSWIYGGARHRDPPDAAGGARLTHDAVGLKDYSPRADAIWSDG